MDKIKLALAAMTVVAVSIGGYVYADAYKTAQESERRTYELGCVITYNHGKHDVFNELVAVDIYDYINHAKADISIRSNKYGLAIAEQVSGDLNLYGKMLQDAVFKQPTMLKETALSITYIEQFHVSRPHPDTPKFNGLVMQGAIQYKGYEPTPFELACHAGKGRLHVRPKYHEKKELFELQYPRFK
ncbi:hypothetical protein [Vibrio owensii]|uniref:hypothetical protein n=1 Tax=Vibrio owensii TaxID=696485 RepID=UPI0018F25946|nr:hypothetical protein [Vibrio owensii]